MPTWSPTMCFRRFRKKHTELSRVYWTQMLGADAIRAAISKAGPNAYSTQVIGSSIPVGMFHFKVAQTGPWLEDYLGRIRLHLLLVCAANLEGYLKEVTTVHLLTRGYGKNLTTLNDVGEALGAPILKKDSLPKPLAYAEQLYRVKYGTSADIWNRSYKLRCALAHNGGVVSARTIREIPDIGLPLNAPITLDWLMLYKSLDAADKIATITDQKVSSSKSTRLEIARELQYLKEAGQLPLEKSIWGLIHKKFGIRSPKAQFGPFIRKTFY